MNEENRPLKVGPDRWVSMPTVALIALIGSCCGASIWATNVYNSVEAIKADQTEIKSRLGRIEQHMGIVRLSDPTRPAVMAATVK